MSVLNGILCNLKAPKLTNILKKSYVEGVTAGALNKKGLVLGVFEDEDTKENRFTAAAHKFNSLSEGRFEEVLKINGLIPQGKVKVFQNLHSDFKAVAVTGIGPEDIGYNPLEYLDECRENVRVATGLGIQALRKFNVYTVQTEGMGNSEAAAEAATLAGWRFHGYRDKENRKPDSSSTLFFDTDEDAWERGVFKGEAQNLARRLSDMPANHLTPIAFANQIIDSLCPCDIVVEVRDRTWMEENHLRASLHISKGSVEPPYFVDLQYCGGEAHDHPISFIGKGVTFDTGGLYKHDCPGECGPGSGMRQFRADMASAAVIISVIRAAAMLQLPLNITGNFAICENAFSGMAMRPGDIITTHGGKTVVLEAPDNDGRVLIGEATEFASIAHEPKLIISVGTLTESINAATGSGASGVFTNNDDLWLEMKKAGSITGDRVWRFPLWDYFDQKVLKITDADITNRGGDVYGGGVCKAAAFIKHFVTCGDWLHMDVAGTSMLATHDDYPYLTVGRMTGRPVRTLIQFLYQLACPQGGSEL